MNSTRSVDVPLQYLYYLLHYVHKINCTDIHCGSHHSDTNELKLLVLTTIHCTNVLQCVAILEVFEICIEQGILTIQMPNIHTAAPYLPL